jgi:GNAT superfamily N-acetyltransferase
MNIKIVVTQEEHYQYAETICDTIEVSAKLRGTGIAKRTPEYILQKMQAKDAIIALVNNEFAGFCYIESWEHAKFVAHSGLIVHPKYRNLGLAKKIKSKVFEYSLRKYPNAKYFVGTVQHFSKAFFTIDRSFWFCLAMMSHIAFSPFWR